MRNANIYDFNWKKLIVPALILLGLIVAGGSYFTVPAGSVAVKLRFGKIVGSYTEGLHLKLPLVDNVEKFSVRIKKDSFDTEAFSKDLQTVGLTLAINHRIQPDTIISIYRNLGPDYTNTVLKPMVEEWTKAVLAKYSAESVISNRVQVAKELDEILKAKMAEKQVIVSDIAKRATNLVEKVKKEAEQKILQAEAEAKSLRLQREVVSDNLIKLRQVEAQLKAIEKWDGRMPTYMAGGELPFVMVK